jgi:translation initiation factor eIF-2B subunit beta
LLFLLFIYLFIYLLMCDASKIEGSQATAKQTAELLRSVISQQRLPQTNQATALINAVRTVGEKLIAANPVGMLRRNFCFS